MNLFARASANLPLTPGERAFLKVVEGVVLTAALAALTAAYPTISTGSLASVDWARTGSVAAIAFLVSMLQAANKYFRAFGDPPLAAVADALTSDAEATLAAHAPAPTPAPVVTPAPAPPAPLPAT